MAKKSWGASGGHNLHSMVEIGLTDVPKSEGVYAPLPPVPPSLQFINMYLPEQKYFFLHAHEQFCNQDLHQIQILLAA